MLAKNVESAKSLHLFTNSFVYVLRYWVGGDTIDTVEMQKIVYLL